MSIPPAGPNPPTPPNPGQPKPAISDSQTTQNPSEIAVTPSSASSERPSSPQDPIPFNSATTKLFEVRQNIEEQKKGINFAKYVNEEMLKKDFEIFGSDPELAPGFIKALNETFEPSDLIEKIVALFKGLPNDIKQITIDHRQSIINTDVIEYTIKEKTLVLFMGKISNLFGIDYNPISSSFYEYDKTIDRLKFDSDDEFNFYDKDQIEESILQASKNFPRIISLIPALAKKLSDNELKAFENYLQRVIEETSFNNEDPANVLTILPLLFRLEAGIKTDLTLDNVTKQKIQEVLKKSIIQIIKSFKFDKEKLLYNLQSFTTQDNASGTKELMSFILANEGQKAINNFRNGYDLDALIDNHMSILKSSGKLHKVVTKEVAERQEDFQTINLVKSLISPATNNSRTNAWRDPINEISQGREGKKGIILTLQDSGIFQSVSDSSLSQLSTSNKLKPTKTMKFLEKLLTDYSFEDLYINGGIIPADLIKELLDINLTEKHFHSKDEAEKIESSFIARIQDFFRKGDFTDLNTYLKRQGVNITNPSPSIVRFLNFMNTLKTLSKQLNFNITFSRSFDITKLLNPPRESIFLGSKFFGLSEEELIRVESKLYTSNSAIDRISLFSKPPRKNNFSRTQFAEKLVANCQFDLANEIDEPTGPCGAVATKIDQEFNQRYDNTIPSFITKKYPNFVVSITKDDDTEEDEIDTDQYSNELDREEQLV